MSLINFQEIEPPRTATKTAQLGSIVFVEFGHCSSCAKWSRCMQSSFGVEQQDRNIRQQNRSVIGARVHHVCSSK
jgi:hypothetical protein